MPQLTPLGDGYAVAGKVLAEFGVREGSRLPLVPIETAPESVQATLAATAAEFDVDPNCTLLFAAPDRYVAYFVVRCDGEDFLDGEVVSVLRPTGAVVQHILPFGGDVLRNCTTDRGLPCLERGISAPSPANEGLLQSGANLPLLSLP
jgi:hypothetical protein